LHFVKFQIIKNV